MCNELESLFEIEASSIKPESSLFDDLDIDSIDAVDLMVNLKSFTGKRIDPTDFKQVRTVQDVVDAVHKILHGEDDSECEQLSAEPQQG